MDDTCTCMTVHVLPGLLTYLIHYAIFNLKFARNHNKLPTDPNLQTFELRHFCEVFEGFPKVTFVLGLFSKVKVN